MTTLDEWFEKYKPIVNETGDSGLFIDDKCYLFETYGADVERVQKACKEDPRTVWTLLDGDEGESVIGDGFHFVNRQGYFITEVPFEGDYLNILLDD